MSNDKLVVEACIREERVAQRQLYEQFAGKLYAVSLRYMKSRDEAQDVLQDAFIKIYKNLHSFRFDCPLEAWLKRIVINTALKAIQKRGQMPTMDIVDYQGDLDENTGNMGLENLKMDTLLGLINELPDGCRAVFNLYAIEGYKHHEIAELLNINEGTSKSQFSRARTLLIEKIEKENIRLAKAN
ncbi:MAG TPA: RNA polymerase sigma factor [Leadbetterella sp.]|nr:RNA polymerase sigma factor [Leadbetterella sp.]